MFCIKFCQQQQNCFPGDSDKNTGQRWRVIFTVRVESRFAQHTCTRIRTVVRPLHGRGTDSSKATSLGGYTPGQGPPNFAKPLRKPLLTKMLLGTPIQCVLCYSLKGVTHLRKKRAPNCIFLFFLMSEGELDISSQFCGC